MKLLTARWGRNPRLCSAQVQRLFAQSHAHLAEFGVETEAVPGLRAPQNYLKETLPRETTSWYVANAFDEGFQLSFHHVCITVAAFDPDRAVFDKVIPIGKPIIDPQTGVMNAEFVPDSTLNAAPKVAFQSPGISAH